MMRVLSIDGGGIRGLLPATIVAEIEARSGRPAHELFDLMVGTSIGGITVLALAAPDLNDRGRARYSAVEILDVYGEVGPRIFSTTLARRLRTGDSLLHEKYSSEAVMEVLDELFDDTPMAAALSPAMVTSYDLESRLPLMFKTEKAKVEPEWNLPMRTVGRAAIAAPTFFEPLQLEITPGDLRTVVDGGVYANNPAMCAYAEALKTIARKDLFMVSIGTGAPTQPLPYEEVREWGLVHWARPLLDLTFDGINHAVNHQLEHLLRPHCYYRLQAFIGNRHMRLDDVSRANRQVMAEAAVKLIAEHDRDFDVIAEELLARAPTTLPDHGEPDSGASPASRLAQPAEPAACG
jgi:predicted acylesterase/phospholipase RssA